MSFLRSEKKKKKRKKKEKKEKTVGALMTLASLKN